MGETKSGGNFAGVAKICYCSIAKIRYSENCFHFFFLEIAKISLLLQNFRYYYEIFAILAKLSLMPLHAPRFFDLLLQNFHSNCKN